MTITEKLSNFIVGSSLEKMPPEVVTLTKRAMIDTLGVALAGSLDPAGKIIAAFVDKCGCQPIAGVIGSKVRTCSPLAALANGTSAHVLDYDDWQFDFQGHISSVLVPVVLALGEETRASGKKIIEAYVLGVELWARLSSLMPYLHLKGWHPTGILGTIGAATTGAKLLKLTAGQTSMALGIACSEAAGLLKNLGTMTKPLQAGNASQNGIVAALLAQDGFTAAKDALEGDANFLTTYYGSSITNVSKIVENLGAPFALVYPGISAKKYPSCGFTHRALDAMLHLISLYNIKPEEVEAIKVYSNPVAQKVLCYTNPRSALEGKFSMQFAMAVALIDRRFGLAQVTEKKVNDLVVKNLMKRITLSVHPDWVTGKDTIYSHADLIEVTTRDRGKYCHEVLVAEGDAKEPLSEAKLLAKYRECARLVLPDKEIEESIDLIWTLEKLDDVARLMQAMQKV